MRQCQQNTMIDLIIPYYNNPNGLLRTLQSILFPDMFYTTIIDDHSLTFPMIYPHKVDQVFRYNTNRGPGCARQWGIEKTNNPWIMFIDTGDIFISRTSFDVINDALRKYPDADIISFPYYYKDKMTNGDDNRLHGKIYKRAFLEKYNITFSSESSYLNEDIGFNRTCNLCTTNIIYQPIPIIRWVEEKNSLTQANGCVSLYRDQTKALSLVSIHTIETCRKNNVPYDTEINQIAIALYYWFLCTAVERPEFLQESWEGAKLFYDKYNEEIKPNNLILGHADLKKVMTYRTMLKFPINILRFANDIKLNDKVPNNYLT